MIHIRPTMAGRYRMVATNAKTGKQRVLADWFPNLITDAGLNLLGSRTNDNLLYCQVGSGTATPNFLDTSLNTFVAQTNTAASGGGFGAQSNPPYYGWRRVVKRFDEGVAAGNLTEVGMCADPVANGIPLFSRALILDGVGNPTTVTVLANEFLDVTYELRLYPPLDDVVSVIADGATNYTVTTRASSVTSGTSIASWADVGYGISAINGGSASWARAHDGPIGPITGAPSGASSTRSSISQDAYQNNSLERTGSMYFGLNNGNFATGIKSVIWVADHLGIYQAEFDPVITKLDTQDLTIGVKVSWARHAP